jgi:hypothetical protein
MNKDYLAGYFDGRANLHISNGPNAKISMIHFDRTVLDYFKENYGGSINTLRNGSYIYQVTGLKAVAILRNLCDDLIIKRDEAENMIKASDLKGYRHPDVVKEREECIKTFNMLKQIRKT